MLLKTITGMHNELASYHGFRATDADCFGFVYDFTAGIEFSLSTLADRFVLGCQSKVADPIVTLSVLVDLLRAQLRIMGA